MVTPSPILVLASNSFSGSSFVNHLLTADHKVIGVSRSVENLPIFSLYQNHKNFKNFTSQKAWFKEMNFFYIVIFILTFEKFQKESINYLI